MSEKNYNLPMIEVPHELMPVIETVERTQAEGLSDTRKQLIAEKAIYNQDLMQAAANSIRNSTDLKEGAKFEPIK